MTYILVALSVTVPLAGAWVWVARTWMQTLLELDAQKNEAVSKKLEDSVEARLAAMEKKISVLQLGRGLHSSGRQQ